MDRHVPATSKPTVAIPTKAELEAALASAMGPWSAVIDGMVRAFGPLDVVWKPSTLAFGRMCVLQVKKRTLLYLIPEGAGFLAAVVLGERAFELAVASAIPASIKRLLSEAKPYVEGRGIRFPVRTDRDVTTVIRLVEFKTQPKGR